MTRPTYRVAAPALALAVMLVGSTAPTALGQAGGPRPGPTGLPPIPAEGPRLHVNDPIEVEQPAEPIDEPDGAMAPSPPTPNLLASAQTVLLFAAISLVPVALLMVSAFVRISVVLALLRQALGSAQVPGNQVMLALSLLLTALVMWPVGERVYEVSVAPAMAGSIGPVEAVEAGVAPLKRFMIEQVARTGHDGYYERMYAHLPESETEPMPTDAYDLPMRVVAPAFLLSELTTALFLGFAIYLPFLVVDLVVAAVLSATGLFMLPPALVSLPLKLVLFVLADGWMLVADMLLSSFAAAPG